MVDGLDLGTVVLLFGWIPFWWAVAALTLYRMNRNDAKDAEREADPA